MKAPSETMGAFLCRDEATKALWRSWGTFYTEMKSRRIYGDPGEDSLYRNEVPKIFIGRFLPTLDHKKSRQPIRLDGPAAFFNPGQKMPRIWNGLQIADFDIGSLFDILELRLIELGRILTDIGEDSAVDINDLTVDEVGCGRC